MMTLSWLTASILAMVLAEGPAPATAAESFHSCSAAEASTCTTQASATAVDTPRAPYYYELRDILCPHLPCGPWSGRGTCCWESGRDQACHPCQDHVSALVGECLNLWGVFWESGCYGEAEHVARQAVTLDGGNLAAQHALAVAEIVNAMHRCCATAGCARKPYGVVVGGATGGICSSRAPADPPVPTAVGCAAEGSCSSSSCSYGEDCSHPCLESCPCHQDGACTKATGKKKAPAGCACAAKCCCAKEANANCACGDKCRCQKPTPHRTTHAKRPQTVVIIIHCPPQLPLPAPPLPPVSWSPRNKHTVERCGAWSYPPRVSGHPSMVFPLPPPPVPPPFPAVQPYNNGFPIYFPVDYWQHPQPPYRE